MSQEVSQVFAQTTVLFIPLGALGAYQIFRFSRARIRGGRSLNVHYFQQVVSEFFNKTINSKRLEDAPEQNFDCSLKGNERRLGFGGSLL